VGDAGTPTVAYTDTRDGTKIAYSRAGDGPPLVFVRALNSHAQRWWTTGWTARYFEMLCRSFSVVLFDARGNGLSGPARTLDIDLLVDDVRAVVHETGVDRVTLFGQGFGTPVAIAYAAAEPERVSRLLLYCAYARGSGVHVSEEFIQTMRTLPEAAAAFMSRETYPDEERLPKRFLTTESLYTSPETAAAYFDFVRTVDVEPSLAEIRVPTLVMQPASSPVVRERLGREVADAIAGSRFVRVPGGAYNPWAELSFEPTLRAIGDFVGTPIPLMPTPKRLAVLLTDIVASTELTHRLGEERAREIFHTHDEVVKEAVRLHGGAEVKHTGDGTMATFTDAEDAVACAVKIEQRLAGGEHRFDDDLQVRIGIALGDVVEERGDLFGVTVMQAVRITDATLADQVLVSEAVHDKLGEDRFSFGPARSVSLKGFPEPARVYEVDWRT
jgi:class 3 adenylate cyclase